MWAYIENNQVVEIFNTLPSSWRNISSPAGLTTEQLISKGIYPYEVIYPTISFVQKYGDVTYDIQTNKVVGTYSIINKTNDEIAYELDQALTEHLDSKAREKRYDNRITCALRAAYNNAWRVEATAFAEWMDQCNVYGYQVMSDCLNGLRTIPTPDEFIAELPVFNWSE